MRKVLKKQIEDKNERLWNLSFADLEVDKEIAQLRKVSLAKES